MVWLNILGFKKTMFDFSSQLYGQLQLGVIKRFLNVFKMYVCAGKLFFFFAFWTLLVTDFHEWIGNIFVTLNSPLKKCWMSYISSLDTDVTLVHILSHSVHFILRAFNQLQLPDCSGCLRRRWASHMSLHQFKNTELLMSFDGGDEGSHAEEIRQRQVTLGQQAESLNISGSNFMPGTSLATIFVLWF